MLGRAFSNTLFPIMIALIPAGIYKLIKKKSTPGLLILIWILWLLLTVMALFGNMLEMKGVN